MSTIIDTFIAPQCDAEIELLYQDDHLVLINKPSGLLSLSGKKSAQFRFCALPAGKALP